MRRLILALLMARLIFYLPIHCFAAETVKQETKGNQSPAQYAGPGGVNTVIYNYTSDITDQFRKCLDFAMDYQTKRLNELNGIIAQYLMQQTGASQEDAQKWAEDLIENAPGFKRDREKQNEAIDQYNKELPKNLLGNVYKLFAYVIETLDSKTAALQKVDPRINYEKDSRFILFKDELTSIDHYAIRTAFLPNGNRIVVTCVTGILQQGIPVRCPSFEFTELVENRAMQTFAIKPTPSTGSIEVGPPGLQLPFKQKRVLENLMYPTTGGETLTTEIKNQFSANLDEFLKLAYAR